MKVILWKIQFMLFMLDAHGDIKTIKDVAWISSRTAVQLQKNTYKEVVSCVTELNLAVNVLDVTF